MIVNCAKSCDSQIESCSLQDVKKRCTKDFLNISHTPIYQPGDMEAMFNAITDKFSDRYPIEIHSTSPWIITLDDFLTELEVSDRNNIPITVILSLITPPLLPPFHLIR